MGTGFYGSNDPTNSVKALKEDRSKIGPDELVSCYYYEVAYKLSNGTKFGDINDLCHNGVMLHYSTTSVFGLWGQFA